MRPLGNRLAILALHIRDERPVSEREPFSNGRSGMTPSGSENALDYELHQQADVLLVRLRGSADHAQTAALQRCFRDVQSQLRTIVVLDLSELTFIASAALGALIALNRFIESRQGELWLTQVPANIRGVLACTHLDRHFRIREDQDRGSRIEDRGSKETLSFLRSSILDPRSSILGA
jgi:anti-anti-sigma factor